MPAMSLRRGAGRSWHLLFLCGLCCWLRPAFTQHAIYGTGASIAKPDVTQLLNTLMTQARPAVESGYRAIGTGSAMAEFLGSLSSPAATNGSSFFVSAAPVASANFTSGILQAPFGVVKVAIWHSIPASNVTSGYVNLTGCVLAGIFAGTISTWDNSAITALNPNLKVPDGTKITVIGNTDVSPTVMSLTNHLQTACAPAPSPWTLGSSLQVTNWPVGTVLAPNTDAVMRKLWSADPTYTPYAITALDFAVGEVANEVYDAGLAEVALQVRNGSFSISEYVDNAATAAMLTTAPAANFPAVTDNWDTAPFRNQLLNGSAASGWPITVPLMILAKQDVTGFGAQGQLLRAFLSFALSDAGQAVVAANMHVPLPAAVRANLAAQLAAALTVSPSTPTWAFETTTEPLTSAKTGEFVFSAYRDSYLDTQAMGVPLLQRQMEALMKRVATLESLAVLAAADRAAAAVDRGRINATVADIAETEAKATTANNIAIAGVVLAVLLAVVALGVAVVYILRTKKLDQKYSKYLPLGVKARFDDTPEV